MKANDEKEQTLYVGIDISKAKFDVSFTLNGVEAFGYQTIINDTDGFKKLLKNSKKEAKRLKIRRVHFVMEATGIYHCGLCEYLQEHSDQLISVVNPVQTKSFAKSHLLRTKNDKVDSIMLAQYGYFHKPKITPKIPEAIKKFRTLVRYQEVLVKNRTQEYCRLEGTLDEDIKEMIKQSIQFIEKQQKEVISSINKLVKNDMFLNHQINLLKTVDGIGDKAAWKILSELKFDSIENISPKAQVAHAGLSPREFSSGSSVKGRSHISKMGNSDIRKVLYLPALGCLKHDNYFTPFYKRLINNGKSHRQAQVAVMRKMLYVSVAVLKHQTPFDKDWVKKYQEKYKEEHMKKTA